MSNARELSQIAAAVVVDTDKNVSLPKNLTFTGTGNRITGDMSNATHANRLSFQTSTTNGATSPFILPNGTANQASLVIANASDPTNSSFGQLVIFGTSEFRINCGVLGTGTYVPLTMYTGGNERLRIDTSGNVGIGTSSPTVISGFTATSIGGTNKGLLTIRSSGTTDAGYVYYTGTQFSIESVALPLNFSSGSANPMTFGTNSTERMRIDSSGNVGIGTSSPSAKFGVSDGTVQIVTSPFGGGLTGYIGTSTNHALGILTNNAERMRIDSSGNCGIGTSSPAAKLEVSNSANSATSIIVRNPNGGASATANARFTNNTSTGEIGQLSTSYAGYGVLTADSTYIYAGNNRPIQLATDNSYIAFGTGTGATERMRIDSSGNLLVGCTSSPSSSVTGSELSNPTIANSAPSANANLVLYKPASAAQTAFVFFNTNNAFIASINQNGNSAVSYNTTSDYRLKENVAPMIGALDKVTQLKPVTYTWKADGSSGQGFIAHELQAVVPDCVTGEKDAVDGEGKPKYQGIDTSFLVATLTAAIQELKAELDSVKAELQTLKGN